MWLRLGDMVGVYVVYRVERGDIAWMIVLMAI